MLMLTWPIIAVGWVVNLFERGTASVIRITNSRPKSPPSTTATPRRHSPPDPATGRDRIPQSHLRLRQRRRNPRPRSASQHLAEDSRRIEPGPRRPDRLRQIHTGQPDPAPLRCPPGSVLIDGRPVREYPLDHLRANIGFVPQETFLFSETIRENIAVWRA